MTLLADVLNKTELKTLKSSGVTLSDDKQQNLQDLTVSIEAIDDLKTIHNRNMLLESILMVLTQCGKQKITLCNSLDISDHVNEDGVQMRRYMVTYTPS